MKTKTKPLGSPEPNGAKTIRKLERAYRFLGVLQIPFRQAFWCIQRRRDQLETEFLRLNHDREGAVAIDLPAIRQAHSLPDFCRSLGINLRPNGSGGTLVGFCPLHAERTPSFCVYPDEHFYCCSCGQHGDVIALCSKLDGLTVLQVAKKLGSGESYCRARSDSSRPFRGRWDMSGAQETPVDRWHALTDSLPWISGHLDPSTFECFKAAVIEGIAREEAFNLVESRIHATGSRPSRSKLERQWRGALKWVADSGGIALAHVDLQERDEPGIDYGRVDSIVHAGPGIYDLWEQSPIRFEEDRAHTEEIIDIVFPDNPWLCIGKGKYHFKTRRRETLRGELAETEFIATNKIPNGLS